MTTRQRPPLPALAIEDDHLSIDRLVHGPSAQEIGDALGARECPDERYFDRFLPYGLRIVSGQYWTPLAVTLRVADWLDRLDVETVVDIGSGAGKFCVATALATNCTFVGIEQRLRLVEAARELAEVFGVSDRVRFIHGALSEGMVPPADAYYMYNPFGENLFGPEDHLDETVELGQQRYERDIAATEALLEQAPIGTYLIKYNGFGGRVPYGYDPVRTALDLPNRLRIWCRHRKSQGGSAA